METDEGAAADGNAGWRAGHHVMVARAVIALVVSNRSDDGVFVRDRCELGKMLREVNPWDARGNRLELPADLDGSFRFRIERLEVGWATIHPDQNAIGRSSPPQFGRTSLPQLKQLSKTASSKTRDSQLQPVPSKHDGLVLVREFGRVEHRPQDIFDQSTPIGTGFFKFGDQSAGFLRGREA